MTATDRVEGRDGTKGEGTEARGRFIPALGVIFMVCVWCAVELELICRYASGRAAAE